MLDFSAAESDTLLPTREDGYRYQAVVENGSTAIHRISQLYPRFDNNVIMVLNGVTDFDLGAPYVQYVTKFPFIEAGAVETLVRGAVAPPGAPSAGIQTSGIPHRAIHGRLPTAARRKGWRGTPGRGLQRHTDFGCGPSCWTASPAAAVQEP